MECDLTESSYKIKIKRQWYNAADKKANAILRCFNKQTMTKPRKLEAYFPLNWTGQHGVCSVLCSIPYEGYFKWSPSRVLMMQKVSQYNI